MSLVEPEDVDKIKGGLALFLMSASYKTLGAVILLERSGYSEDAEKLSRSIYDGYVHLATILKDSTNDMAKQFLLFDYVTRAGMYNKVKTVPSFQEYFEERAKNPAPKDESIAEIEEKSKEWVDQYGKSWHNWVAGKTSTEQARDIGIEPYFNVVYPLQSHLIHVLPRVMDRYLTYANGFMELLAEPNDKNIDAGLTTAFNMACNTTVKFAEHFGLPLDNLEAISNRYIEVVPKLKE